MDEKLLVRHHVKLWKHDDIHNQWGFLTRLCSSCCTLVPAHQQLQCAICQTQMFSLAGASPLTGGRFTIWLPRAVPFHNKQTKKEHQSMYKACTSCSSWRRSTCQRLRWCTSTPPLSILTSSITIWYSAATAKDYSTSFVLLRMWLATICHVSGTCTPLGFWGG